MNKTTFKINTEQKTTQGKLHLVTEISGDIIKSSETIIGFSHKGIEKLAELSTYEKYTNVLKTFENAVFYQEAFCSAVEKLQNIEIPERAMYTRVFLMETERIYSHLNWLYWFLDNVGIIKSSFDFLKEAYNVRKLFETDKYITFGGVSTDVNKTDIGRTKEFIKMFVPTFEKLVSSLNTNIAFRNKIENIGILTKNTALSFSITGANLRASGINLDIRKTNPYLIYDKINIEIPTFKGGDCFARYLERIEEIKESLLILEQCIKYLQNTDGEICNKKEFESTEKNGIAVSYTEAPRGLLSCTVIADGNEKPYRVKWRTPSFYSVQVLPVLLKNRNFEDLSTIVGSMDIDMSEVDR